MNAEENSPSPAAPEPGDRRLVTKWFIRLLGVVHLCNFGSLAAQVQRCLGSDGLLPVQDYVRQIHAHAGWTVWDKLLECPSVFLWIPGDAWLIGGAWLGVILAILTIGGFQSRTCFAAMFVLYGSYIEVGQELYSFQWDYLILETTFLAMLLPNSGFCFRRWTRGADTLTIWLFQWLLFRLYIESGLAKLFWGPDTWATLDAMRRYYETAPIPTLLGWYAHALPDSWHQFETGATLAIELLGPALIFSGAWPRRIGFAIFSAFQIAIILTANYGIFNYNTLCLHLFLLTDRDILAAFRWIPAIRGRPPDISDVPRRPSRWMYPIAAVLIFASIVEFMMLAGGRAAYQTVLAKYDRYIRATHISSKYHLFGPIDPIRYEMVFEASPDGDTWVEYEFPCKAGDLRRPPPFVAPHHPRVDFRLWFERYPLRWQNNERPYPDASVSPAMLPAYVGKLCLQILAAPNLALRHFTGDPLNGYPPREVRITFYYYRMTRRGTEAAKSAYWEREKVGTVYVDPDLGQNGRPMAVPSRTTQHRSAPLQ